MSTTTPTVITAWDPAYEVGIHEIDEQHKFLFELTALFALAITKGSEQQKLRAMIVELTNYADYHFTTEELYFAEHPDCAGHKDLHAKFLKQLKQFEQDLLDHKENLAAELTGFVTNWLKEHITQVDQRFLAP